MILEKEDFDAKALQIQEEITQQLTILCSKRGNKNLPVKIVNEVFHRAISHYLFWAYLEGLNVDKSKNNNIKSFFQKLKK